MLFLFTLSLQLLAGILYFIGYSAMGGIG